MSDPVAQRFAELQATGRRALVVYLTAGYPGSEESIELMRRVVAAGADIVEVGVPFSDPMADGPVIQASSQLALEGGMTFNATLELIRRAALDVPVVLFSYLNPILAAGEDALERAAAAGVHGLLVTDLPVGADPELEARLASGPLALVRLVAPTTPVERMAEISGSGSGFIYVISRLGVTGMSEGVATDLRDTIERLRSVSTLPVCVGFGISNGDQAREVAELADGVVVGSALVRAAGDSIEAAEELTRELRAAIDGVGLAAAG